MCSSISWIKECKITPKFVITFALQPHLLQNSALKTSEGLRWPKIPKLMFKIFNLSLVPQPITPTSSTPSKYCRPTYLHPFNIKSWKMTLIKLRSYMCVIYYLYSREYALRIVNSLDLLYHQKIQWIPIFNRAHNSCNWAPWRTFPRFPDIRPSNPEQKLLEPPVSVHQRARASGIANATRSDVPSKRSGQGIIHP